MSDSDRFWRVYRSEWAGVYTSDADGVTGKSECTEKLDEAYAGRLHREEARVVPWSSSQPELWPWLLELYLPVMKGEYSSHPLALEHARKVGGSVVLEGSQDDRKFLGYGKLMLRREHVDSSDMGGESVARGASGQAG